MFLSIGLTGFSYQPGIIYSHVFIHWFNRVLHVFSQDYARLPRLSLLSSVGQLGHDDFGLAEEFVRRTDLTGPLGSDMGAIWGLWVWGCCENVGIGWLDWIAHSSLLSGQIRSPQRFSDVMDPFLVAGFYTSENSGGRTEHPCAEKRSFGVLDGRWDLHGSTSDII